VHVALRQSVALEPEGEVLPYFERRRVSLTLDGAYAQLQVSDRATHEELWRSTSLLPSQSLHYYFFRTFQNAPNVHNTAYRVQGHLVVFTLGHVVYAFDPVEQRKLWERSLLSPGAVSPNYTLANGNRLERDQDGSTVLISQTGNKQKIGQTGPVEALYVSLLTRQGLVVLDPLSGAVLWTRGDVYPSGQLFGDDQHLYLVETSAGGEVLSTRAMRAHDGVTVKVPEFGRLYRHRIRTLGRNLLLAETDPQGGLHVRLYDVHTGADLWKRTFAAGARVAKTQDPFLLGVVEPGGTVLGFDLRGPREVLHARLDDPKHLDRLKDVHLLADRDQFYLAIQQTAEGAGIRFGGQGQGPWSNLSQGMSSVPVHGMVYAFDRATGRRTWRSGEPVFNQMLVLEQFNDLPIMLFTARSFRVVHNGNRMSQQLSTAVLSLDKRTGKVLFASDPRQPISQFRALYADTRTGTIDLVGDQSKIRHYLENSVGANPPPALPATDRPPARPRAGEPLPPGAFPRVRVRLPPDQVN
jgi:outer membrane protein assembly factor BamB